MRYDVESDFKTYPMSVECAKANGDTAIFNCDVCGRHCYFASPCTPDDCEARFEEFCKGEESEAENSD